MEGLTKYGKPFIIVAATGAGKSLIIADVCHRLNKPTLILQPNKEILEQNYDKLKSYGVEDIAMYSASVGQKEIAKYTYATIQSIYKKPELFTQFEYVVIDECHQVDPKNFSGMYRTFLKAIGTERVMGLTATPYRIVNKFITDEYDQQWYTGTLKMINRIAPFFFKKIAYKIETQELIDAGYLVPVDYYSYEFNFDELTVNSTGNDFTVDSLDRYWNDARLMKIAAGVLYAEKNHKRSLTFCSSILQATNLKAMLDELETNAELVTGETPKKRRGEIVDAYKRGEIKHLLNVGVFTTGFDVPELDAVILARPTMSLALYYQMVGRGVRLDPSDPTKRLSVYDLAGVSDRMGKVETIRIKTEEGGFRDEVWSERGRLDERAIFEWFVKRTPKHLR